MKLFLTTDQLDRLLESSPELQVEITNQVKANLVTRIAKRWADKVSGALQLQASVVEAEVLGDANRFALRIAEKWKGVLRHELEVAVKELVAKTLSDPTFQEMMVSTSVKLMEQQMTQLTREKIREELKKNLEAVKIVY